MPAANHVEDQTRAWTRDHARKREILHSDVERWLVEPQVRTLRSRQSPGPAAVRPGRADRARGRSLCHQSARRRARRGSPGRCARPEGRCPIADRLARSGGRSQCDRRNRASHRSWRQPLSRARAHHGRADRRPAHALRLRPRSPSGRDRAHRRVPEPRSPFAPGRMLRYGVSSRHAAPRPDRADPPGATRPPGSGAMDSTACRMLI